MDLALRHLPRQASPCRHGHPGIIETAVLGLDGAERTLVVIELASGRTLTVGGGPERVVAEVAGHDAGRWCVVDARQPDGMVALVMDGELIDAPARLCVEKEAALEAARTFVSENGARSRRLAWSAF